MSISSYASLRTTTPGVTFSAASGGSLSAGSLWFSVQAMNRVGRNLLSTPVQVTWSTGGKVTIAFSSAARANAEEIYEYIISAAPTNDPETMQRLFSLRARNTLTVSDVDYPGQGAYIALSHTVELTQNQQIAIAPSVPTPEDLPTANLLYGMARFIASTSEYVKYDNLATSGLYEADAGYWISDSLSDISTYLSATTDTGGCDRPLISLSPSDIKYPPPAYSGSGSDSYPVQFWYSNGLSEGSGAAEPQGTTLTLQLAANGRNISDAFSGRAYLKLLGYVKRSDGTLNASIPTVGDTLTWSAADSPAELPQDLPKGYAAAYELVFRFRNTELQSVIQRGTQITTLLYPEGLLGKPDSSWAITGDIVIQVGELMRIVPVSGGVKRLSGKCLIGGYRSPSVGETELIGLPFDQATFKITVSAALAGALAYRLPADNILTTEAVRAIASTSSGIAGASNLSAALTIIDSTQGIRLTIDYPAEVRADYPDRIAGSPAEFNVPQVYVYVAQFATGNIYQLPEVAPTGTIDIISLSDAIVVDSLPTAPASNFCLFGYGEIAAVAQDVSPSSSTLDPGDYQVAIAYYFPSPNDRVTSISHSEAEGCIPEFIPLQEAIAQSSEILSGSVPPLAGDGTENDIYFEAASSSLNIYKKSSPDTWSLTGTIEAPAGATGPSAYTRTTASFTQLASGSSVSVAVLDTSWMAIGANVFIESGGSYQVMSIASSTSVSLKNLGYGGNAAPGTTIAINKKVGPSGVAGATGSVEASSGLGLTHLAEPPGTDAGKSALFVGTDEDLKLRRQSNGMVTVVATTDRQNTFQKPVSGTLTTIAPATTITLDCSASSFFRISVEEDTLIDNPIGIVNNAPYFFLIKQSGAGGYAITFGSLWIFPENIPPDLTATAGQSWMIKALAIGGILYSVAEGWYEPPTMLDMIAYWDFDSGSATSQTDSVNGYVLSGSDCALLSGVSGSAIAVTSNTSYLASTNPALSLAVVAWRIEFDFYLDAEPTSGSATSPIIYGNEEWILTYRASFDAFRLQIYDDTGGVYTISSSIALSVGVWYAIVISCTPGVEASLKIDANPPETVSIGATGVSTDFEFAIRPQPLAAAAAKYRIDNLKIFKA